ncbi:MAG: DNA repair protein RecO [Anaerolineae bacterium]|nr:DNA repair protein RecO [Anaerolineae bacterium]
MPERERLYRTEGIVIKRSDFGEADRLLVLLTPAFGKLRVLAKGVRKVPSRKAGHVEPFMRSQFLLARGRDLDIVTQAEAVEVYQGLREELERATYAFYLAELVDAFAEEGGENRALYALLADTLARLAAGDEPALLTRFFELRLLECAGYRPELQRCVGCGASHEPTAVYFSVAEGGARCPHCGEGATGLLSLSLNAFKVLRYMQGNDYGAVSALRLRTETLREIEAVLHRYLTWILERNLKSLSFLGQVRSWAPQAREQGQGT